MHLQHLRTNLLRASLLGAVVLAASACGGGSFVGPLTTDGDPIDLLCGAKTDTAIDQLRPEPATAADTMPVLGNRQIVRRTDGGSCTYPVGNGNVHLAIWDTASANDARTLYIAQLARRRTQKALDVKGLADKAELLDDGSVLVRRNDRVLLIDLATKPVVIENAGPALTYFFLDGLCH